MSMPCASMRQRGRGFHAFGCILNDLNLQCLLTAYHEGDLAGCEVSRPVEDHFLTAV